MIAYRVLAAAAGFGLGFFTVQAGSAQTIVAATLLVSANMAQSCTATQGAAVAFGTMTSAQALGQTAVGSVAVACDPGVAFAVGLDYGGRPTGGGTVRNMACTGSASLLTYELYAASADPNVASTNPIVPIVINTSTTGSSTANTPGGVGVAGQSVTVPVFGKILSANPASCPGGYTDQVTITIGF